MKLKDFNFNSIDIFPLTNLIIKEEGASIGEKERCFEEGSIGLTLKSIPIRWAEREIKDSWWFFNTYVIELKGLGTGVFDEDGNELIHFKEEV